MPPSSTSSKTRTTTTSSATARSTRTRSAAPTSSANDLTTKMASMALKASPQDIRISAMRSANAASQGLSAVVQTGWKKSSASKTIKTKAETLVISAASKAAAALAELRELSPGEVDIERSASSIVAKLIALEMFDLAAVALSLSRKPVSALCNVVAHNPKSSKTIPLHLISLSPPDGTVDIVLLTLASTHLSQALVVVSALLPSPELPAFATALKNGVTITHWIPILKSSTIPEKHVDSILTRAYASLTKAVSNITITDTNYVDAFHVRMYAMTCLVHTTPGTIAPTTFWDQTIKFGASFIHASPTALRDDATKNVLEAYNTIVSVITPSENPLLSGKGFVSFCDYWMEFAKRAGDIKSLDRIGGLTSGIASTSRTLDGDAFALQASKLCTVFAQTTAVLEQQEDNEDCSDRIAAATSAVQTFGTSVPASEDDDVQRVKSKLERALERLRRAAVKFLDRHPTHESIQDLLGSIFKVLQDRRPPSIDTISPALDIIFTLSRTKLSISDPRTYAPSFAWMERGAQLLGSSSEKTYPERANYVRCVAGAFYNLAGTLYQAGKHGPAIKFLREGCVLGSRALGEYNASSREGTTEDVDVWRQLYEGLYRRWELLGACYSKIPDRKLALEALIECIKSFPYHDQYQGVAGTFGDKLGTLPHMALFTATTSLKQLGVLVDRVTQLAVVELLQTPSEASLRSHMPVSDADSDPNTLPYMGIILERQIHALEGSVGKESVRLAVEAFLNDALSVYTVDSMPIRRARVLVKCLEFKYHAGVDSGMLRGLGSPDEIAKVIEDCLTTKQFGKDTGLMHFRAQYRASAHLWLALHAHRRADEQQSTLAATHADLASKILKELISPVAPPSPVTPKGTKASKASASRNPPAAPGKRRIPVRAPPPTRAAAPKRAAAAKSTPATTKNPVTPKRGKSAKKVPTPSNMSPAKSLVAETKKDVLVFDDFDEFLGLLQIVARLLGLLGLALPRVAIFYTARRLCERRLVASDDAYIITSVDLAYEYLCLGKTRRAASIYAHVLNAIREAKHAASPEVQITFLLRYAHSLAIADCVPESSESYIEALSLSNDLPAEEKGSSSAQRLRARVMTLERAAIASHAFAAIQFSKEDVTTSLEGLLQSLRLWNRAIDNLARLLPPPPAAKVPVVESNPFDMGSLADALPATPVASVPEEKTAAQKFFARRPSMDGLEWRIAEGLLTTLFAISQAYFSRGSAREAEYFAQQAHDLALSLNAPAMVSRALARKGEVQIHQGKLSEGLQSLVQASSMLNSSSSADFADIQRLKGDYSLMSDSKDNKGTAEEMYGVAMSVLDELNNTFGTLDGIAGPRKSAATSPSHVQPTEVLVPALLAVVLRQHIWLLRDNASDASRQLLERFLSLPASAQIKLKENGLMAKLALHEVYELFRSDMFLSSLAESTIALPMGMSCNGQITVSPATQEILATLDNAEELFWVDLAVVARRGDVSNVRNAAVSLALIRALQTSLGQTSLEGPVVASRLLDISTAITLRRELLETIQNKFHNAETFDNLQWPLIDSAGSSLPLPTNARTRARSALLGVSQNTEDNEEKSLKAYWHSIRTKYEQSTADAPNLSVSQTASLPVNWTVVHISVTDDKSTLFITRQRGGGQTNDSTDSAADPCPEPLMFCVPLKGRRENGTGDQEDDHLSFDGAMDELKEIIRLSDKGTRGAADIKPADVAARTQWWKNRAELDKRMEDLVENVEFCWLGAFKTILNPAPGLPVEAIAELRTQFDKVFQWSLHSQDKKPKALTRHKSTNSVQAATASHGSSPSVSMSSQQLSLDDSLIECFSTLSPKCRDEELEDLVYFVLDLYQFHGVSVAIAEVDIDQVVVDLRTVLDEFSAKRSRGGHKTPPAVINDEHIFLVLDKNVHGIPWESIPVLRGRSVSRIPSVEFLKDRVEFAAWQKRKNGHHYDSDHSARVNPRKAYYVLNPSGDLDKTEGRFKDWLTKMETVGWEGVAGKPPSEQQFLNALAGQDLVVYFGHGGGEQYVRSHKIRNLPRCAATMLWGCSSGALKEMGDFDPVGTPYNYMLAGCPTLVANLWDITDRDIDKFSQLVFDQLRLTPDAVKRWNGPDDNSVSVVAAVAQAREACKLKYLTGSAPVVYGIPFYL